LTLSLPLSKLRTRWLTFFLEKKGLFQRRPFSLTVPTYLPNRLTTAAWLGSTMYRPNRQMKAAMIAVRPSTSHVTESVLAPVYMRYAPNSRPASRTSSIGMPEAERSGFSFMAVLVVRPWMGHEIVISK
jgi:hypothetical protein